MATFAFNDKLEKVQIFRLQKKLSCPAEDSTTFSWTAEELTAAGVGLDLTNYSIIGFEYGYTDYPEQWYSYLMGVMNSSNLSLYPRPYIDTWENQVKVIFYNSEASAQTITVRVTLLKVA